MKKNIFLLILALTILSTNGQSELFMTDYVNEIQHYVNGIDKTIGNSFLANKNINNESATDFQDYKRAIVVVFVKKDDMWRRGSGVLINTIQNSFEAGKRKFYILTAHHVGNNDNLYISFNYEMPHTTDRGGDATNRDITKVYSIPFATKIVDGSSDLALLEVDINEMITNPQDYEDPESVFYNSYALGWDLNPKFIKENLINISHPRGDVKKIFKNPQELRFVSNFKLGNTVYDFKNKKLIVVEGLWDTGAFPQRGSSGSPLMNIHTGKILAVLSSGNLLKSGIELGINRFSSLTNSWIKNGAMQGFKHLLDPEDTWVSSIPGGYIEELIPNTHPIDFDLNLSIEKIEKTIPSLSAIDFFGFELEESLNEKRLGDGILLTENETLDQDQTITLELKASNDDLLYTANYSIDGINTQTTRFKGKSDNQYIIPRLNFKNQLIQNLRNINNSNHYVSSLTRLKTFEIDNTKISLKTNEGTAQVRAIKLPSLMPYNAVELFEPERFGNLWRSYRYPESRGNNSTDLHINRIKVELQPYIYDETSDPPKCDLLAPFTLQDISTGNNGGYLNLVNPNYQINNVLASDSRCGYNKLITTLYTNQTNINKYFGSFVDYTKTSNEQTLLYNLTDATTRTPESNPSNNTKIVIEHDIPFEENLNFQSTGPSSSIKARYRVGVSNTTLAPDGFYKQGEVEDYVLNIRKNASMTRSEWLRVLDATILMTAAAVTAGQCLPDIGEGDGTEFEGIDETLPIHNLPLFGIGDGGCFDMLDLVNTYIGSNALIFNGQMFMDIARGSEIVHQATSEKTISIDFLVEDTNTTIDEILFEEGGAANGLSIRRNDNHIEYGVRINNQLVAIASTTILAVNQMTNVTVVFNDGIMELYLNGEPEAASNIFATQDITTIPEHLDDASLGGTHGTNIWNTVVSNFNGVVDYFGYWTKSLTPVMIGLIARPIAQKNNRRQLATNNADTPLKLKEDLREPDFSIFPNPVKEELNILLEIEQVGPLKIDLFDINGKKVYEMKKSTISKGHQLITLRDLKIAAGEYIMSIRAGNIKRNEKVIFKQ
jgi:hypothetical protein